ncbi:MAG: NADH:flavin oxidoreductase/NADH oxidase [Gammaproteobacteria bacterium]|nr:NADH:flavin oxidoreductase/NADH oxidase [Gammaproteobacteria bacterium]
MSELFSFLELRGLRLKNRIFVSPMCQYSAPEGLANSWHLVHLGSRAVGGAALVMTEAAAVSPAGRISPQDLGIWSRSHADALAPVARFISEHGAVPAIQLAHAGRKASTDEPWRGGGPVRPDGGGWQPLAPSPVSFAPNSPVPAALTIADIDRVVGEFADAARLSLHAGFRVAEIHMAHGYLLHEFLSPISNRRDDEYGGSLDNRMRFPLRVARAVREAWPEDLPVFVRISATDWVDGGWDLGQSIQLALRLKRAGIDFIDCSSGGLVPDARVPAGPGFQVPFATAVKSGAGISVGAVGLVTGAFQAEQIVATGLADAVLLARQLLRDPYWPLHAARSLGVDLPWPVQYERAKLR